MAVNRQKVCTTLQRSFLRKRNPTHRTNYDIAAQLECDNGEEKTLNAFERAVK